MIPGPLGVDLTDLDNFAHGFPHDVFARHRAECPIFWHEPTEKTPDGDGFWSIATHAPTLAVLHDAGTFSSETGGDRPFGGTLIPDTPSSGSLLIMMDDPRHLRLRKLVNKGFTPRMIAALEDGLRARTRNILEGVIESGPGAAGSAGAEFDFVTAIAAELPVQVISQLIGAHDEDRAQLVDWVEKGLDIRTGESYGQSPESTEALLNIVSYGSRLIEEKRSEPGDDMLSIVVHAELPGEDPPRLSDEELVMFFSLLFPAGAHTTRNAIAGGMLALVDNPDQIVLLRNEPALLDRCVEEIVRWVSPAAYNRRTVTRPVELGGCAMSPGDKVVFWEASANRDEEVFPESMTFRVDRDPNPHVGFGHGPHHCLGAALARLELRVIFGEILSTFPTLERVGEPEWTRTNKHNGLRHLRLRRAVGRSGGTGQLR